MSLTDLWVNSRTLLEDKHIHQIITFAGDGKLKDGENASREFRDFLSLIPSELLMRYVKQCLQDSYPDSGFVLQDLVNQIGRRLGFTVLDGLYRGVKGQLGCDGIWSFPNGHTLVVEVKTTDAYQITLDTLAKYRRDLIVQNKCTEETSSILIVLGREDRDTSDLEAQIRGSHYARNIRLISIEALGRLMSLKAEVSDPEIVNRISQVLIPREYTKLDEIVALVFFTATDIKQEKTEVEEIEADGENKTIRDTNKRDGLLNADLFKVGAEDSRIRATNEPSISTAGSEAYIARIQKYFDQLLIKRSRVSYSSHDEALKLVCLSSKLYMNTGHRGYWFAFHPYQKQYLESAKTAFIVFGCGSAETLLMIPVQDFVGWLDQLNTTEKEGRMYWHVIIRHDEKFVLQTRRGTQRIDLSSYKLT